LDIDDAETLIFWASEKFPKTPTRFIHHRPTMARRKDLEPMVNWVYDLVLWMFTIVVDLFFREVHPRGSWKVPRRGPVIFVAAPHANQVSRTVFLYELY
jgi:1-acyl-sn-glycerol-3-phosphate acyltransferase